MAEGISLFNYISGQATGLNDPYGQQDSKNSLKWESHAKFSLDYKEYDYYGSEDQKYLVTWSDDIFAALRETITGINSNKPNEVIGEIGHFVRNFINKNLVSKYGTQEYMHENAKGGNSIWISEGITFLEKMLEPVTLGFQPKFTNRDGGGSLNKGDQINCFYMFANRGGEVFETAKDANGVEVVANNGTFINGLKYTLGLSQNNGERLTEQANEIIRLWKQYSTSQKFDYEASKRLNLLGYQLPRFRREVLDAAKLLVAGQVNTGANGLPLQVLSSPGNALAFQLDGDPSFIKINFWFQDLAGAIQGTKFNPYDYFSEWPKKYNWSEIKPSIIIRDETSIESVTGVINKRISLKIEKLDSGKGTISGRTKTVEMDESKNFHFSFDAETQEKYEDLESITKNIWQKKVSPPNWVSQKEGIPSSITDLSQLANAYKEIQESVTGEWWDIDQGELPPSILRQAQSEEDEVAGSFISQSGVGGPVTNKAYKEGIKLINSKIGGNPIEEDNPLNIADNAWARLEHILSTTQEANLSEQKSYGLRNANAKTDENFLNEAIGSAAYLVAFQFLFFSALSEVVQLAEEIADLEGQEVTNDLIDAIEQKALNADTNALIEGAGSSATQEEEKLSEKVIDERQVFLRQCALLMNMDTLKGLYKKTFFDPNNANTFDNKIWTVDVNDSQRRSDIINFLTASPYKSIGSFLKLSPELQACLAPKLRFFKVFNDKTNKDNIKEIEFSFPYHYNPDDSAYKLNETGQVFRGSGMGIRSFSFNFEGTSPATARNDIVAELNLFFQDFTELLKYRSGDNLFSDKGQGEKYRYIDLLLLPGSKMNKKKDPENDEDLYNHYAAYNPSDHRIRVDVGWVVRDDTLFSNLVKNRGLTKSMGKDKEPLNLINEALQVINKSYYLNMVDHNIDFLDDGSVELKVNYRAWLESSTKQNQLDALLSPELALDRINMTRDYNSLLEKKSCADADGNYTEDFQELIGTFNAIELDILQRSHQSIVERLIKKGKLHYCFLNEKDINFFKDKGFFRTTPEIHFAKGGNGIVSTDTAVELKEVVVDETKPLAEQETQYEAELYLDSTLIHMSPEYVSPRNVGKMITFFYFGDLINIVMDCMKDPTTVDKALYPEFRKTKIILSSFDYVNHLMEDKNINLSEIPISTEYFFEWMNQNVVKTKRRTYPLTYFIRDICNKLVANLLLEVCINRNPVKTLSFKTINLLGVVDSPADPDPFLEMPKMAGPHSIHYDVAEAHSKGLGLPLRGNIGNKSLNSAYNYIAIYPTTDNQSYGGTGKFFEDGKKGIYHFGLGSNRGIIKTIKFAKTDIQYIREARFFNHGHDGLMQLSAVYKVTLEMFGNTIFYPGMLIFIDPRELGGSDFDPTIGRTADTEPSVANSLGIGGYHLITRVSSNIEPGNFSTTIEAQFVYSGDGSEKNRMKKKINKKPQSIESTVFSADSIDNYCEKITAVYGQVLEGGSIGTPKSKLKSIADKTEEELDGIILDNANNSSISN